MQTFSISQKNATPFITDIFSKICIFFLLLNLTNKDFGSISSLVYWGLILVGLGGSVLKLCMTKKNLVFTTFIWWYLAFFVVCVTSLMYSIQLSASIESIKTMVVNASTLFCLAWMIDTKEDINTIIKILLLVTVCNAIYLCFTVDWASMGIERMDATEIGVGWNSNEIGLMMLWGTMLCCYLAKALKKPGYYLAIPLFFSLIVYSGSRKVWLGVVLFVMVLIYINNKRRLFTSIIVSVFVLITLYNLIMNVEWLYNIGGERLQQFFDGLLGTGEYDTSAALREKFINYGWNWFLENPIFGYGINTFRKLLSGVMGRSTYSHNNYIELLVGVGIIGAIVFYYIYLKVVKMGLSSIFNKNKDQSPQAHILLALILIHIPLQIGMVSYQSIYDLILLLLVFYYFRFEEIKYKEGLKNEHSLVR